MPEDIDFQEVKMPQLADSFDIEAYERALEYIQATHSQRRRLFPRNRNIDSGLPPVHARLYKDAEAKRERKRLLANLNPRSVVRSESPSQIQSLLEPYSALQSFHIPSAHHSRSGLQSRHSSIGVPSIGIRALGRRPNSRKSSQHLLANVPGIRPAAAIHKDSVSYSELKTLEKTPSCRPYNSFLQDLSLLQRASVISNSSQPSRAHSPTRRLSVFIKSLKQSSLNTIAQRASTTLAKEASLSRHSSRIQPQLEQANGAPRSPPNPRAPSTLASPYSQSDFEVSGVVKASPLEDLQNGRGGKRKSVQSGQSKGNDTLQALKVRPPKVIVDRKFDQK